MSRYAHGHSFGAIIAFDVPRQLEHAAHTPALLAMIDGGHGALALSYAAVSIVAGLVAVLVAVRLAARGEGQR